MAENETVAARGWGGEDQTTKRQRERALGGDGEALHLDCGGT